MDEVERAYYARPLWQRMAVVTAGVIMNVILAIVVISFLFATQGVPLPTDNIIVTEVAPNSPAAIAGILKNDRILKIDGKQ